MKSIGIKLADGTFYPLLEEGNPEKRTLDLTTVMDNQTKVQVEVYRTETGTMEGAEYVDTLEIKNLKPHQNGEPTLMLSIDVDEDNKLSAEILDPETGKSSDLSVTLVSKTLAGLPDETNENESELKPKEEEFAFDDVNEAFSDQVEEPENNPVDEEVSPDENTSFNDDFDFDANDSVDETQTEDSSATDDLNLDLPDFDDDTDEIIDTFGSDKTDSTAEETTDEKSVKTADATETTDGSMNFNLPDFDDKASDDSLSPDLPDFNDNIFDSSESVEDTNSFANDSDMNFDLPDFDNEGVEEKSNSEDDMFMNNHNKDDSLDSLDDLDLPDLDDNTSSTSKDPTFEPSTSMFSNLYDDNDSYEEQSDSGKTKVPMIVCIVCAVICVVAVILMLFVIPSRFNILSSGQAEEVVEKVEGPEEAEELTENKAEPDVTAIPEPEKIPVPAENKPAAETPVVQTAPVEQTPAPAAKENEIVIASTPEAVVPKAPAPKKTAPKTIKYKIKWGDTLWDISDAYYKNPWKYKKLARYNKIKNPDKIISGKTILIPEE